MIPQHVCPRDWVGQTTVIVASGPSTQKVDLRKIGKKRVIAVAHGYLAVPDADVLVIGGRAFYQSNDLANYHGNLIVAAQEMPGVAQIDPRQVYMRRDGKHGLTDDPGALRGSESSVMLAINYAIHRGVSRILLLGCDGTPSADGQRRIGKPTVDTYNARQRYLIQEQAMATQIEPLQQRGIEIFNCSPGTLLTIYPIAELKDFK